MKELETLHGYHLIYQYGNCYGIQPLTNVMIGKINELVEVVNHLQHDIAYLKCQGDKRKKYKVIRRYDVLLLAKQRLKSGEFLGLCNAIKYSLAQYSLEDRPSSYFPLFTRDQALKFRANKDRNYWWKPGKFGILSGRRMYLNWLIRKYKNDTKILNTIEIYD